jgi:hypothetical protein
MTKTLSLLVIVNSDQILIKAGEVADTVESAHHSLS